MELSILIMLFGVGFFSFIMQGLGEILESYAAKMGIVDRTDELAYWVETLLRFSPNK